MVLYDYFLCIFFNEKNQPKNTNPTCKIWNLPKKNGERSDSFERTETATGLTSSHLWVQWIPRGNPRYVTVTARQAGPTSWPSTPRVRTEKGCCLRHVATRQPLVLDKYLFYLDGRGWQKQPPIVGPTVTSLLSRWAEPHCHPGPNSSSPHPPIRCSNRENYMPKTRLLSTRSMG